MARTISDEEILLRKRARRRLIGAVILVAGVVVLLPMVLDSEPKPETQDINIRIPAPDATTFSPNVAPALRAEATSDPVATAPEAKSAPPARASSPAAKPEARPEPPGRAPAKAVAKAPKAAAEPSLEAAGAKAQRAATELTKPKSQEYILQVIALADADRAKQVQKQISAAGIKSYTEIVETAKGPVTRVRVGPFANQDAAEKARVQLQGIGLDGKVIPR